MLISLEKAFRWWRQPRHITRKIANRSHKRAKAHHFHPSRARCLSTRKGLPLPSSHTYSHTNTCTHSSLNKAPNCCCCCCWRTSPVLVPCFHPTSWENLNIFRITFSIKRLCIYGENMLFFCATGCCALCDFFSCAPGWCLDVWRWCCLTRSNQTPCDIFTLQWTFGSLFLAKGVYHWVVGWKMGWEVLLEVFCAVCPRKWFHWCVFVLFRICEVTCRIADLKNGGESGFFVCGGFMFVSSYLFLTMSFKSS